MALRRNDLHVLIALDALFEQRSVTRAATKLNLTQPAVSQALARARQLFADQLVVRVGNRMILTPRAESLAGQLGEWRVTTESILTPPSFDPATSQRQFTISSNDFTEFALLPPFIREVRRAAPSVRLALRSVEAAPVSSEESREGRGDLLITGVDLPSDAFVELPLYREHFVLMARKGHSALVGSMSPERFVAFPHALVLPQGGVVSGPIDSALATLGLTRNVALSLTRFSSLSAILVESDLIAAVPSRLMDLADVKDTCAFRALPFESPTFTMRLGWHRRHANDPGHQWIRQVASTIGVSTTAIGTGFDGFE